MIMNYINCLKLYGFKNIFKTQTEIQNEDTQKIEIKIVNNELITMIYKKQ